LAAFSIQESHSEENILNKWDSLGFSSINPQDVGPSWTLEMQEGSLFELNVSASGTVRVRIGTSVYDEVTGEPILRNPPFLLIAHICTSIAITI